jgi:hypothetical protein
LFKSVLLLFKNDKNLSLNNQEKLLQNKNFKNYVKNFLTEEKKKLLLKKFMLSKRKLNKSNALIIKFIKDKINVLNYYLTLIHNETFFENLVKSFFKKENFIKNGPKIKSKSFLIKKRRLSSINNLEKSTKLRIFSNSKELKRIKHLIKMQRVKKQRSRLKKIHRPH